MIHRPRPTFPRRSSRRRSIALLGSVVALACASLPIAPEMGQGQGRMAVRRAVDLHHSERLQPFRDALTDLESGDRRRVRVMHYGDSNVAADMWSKVFREALHERFGDGGPGYVVPRPWGSRTDDRLRFGGGEGWEPRRLGFARDFGPADGLWGLAGVAIAGAPGDLLTVEIPSTQVPGFLEAHFLGMPRPGSVVIRSIDQRRSLIELEREAPELVRHRIELDGSPKRIRLGVPRGEARLLGFVMELTQPGVVYDVLGINGHRAAAWLRWNEDLLRTQLEGRPPDLLILSYGGNEALDPGLPLDRYQRELDQSIARARRLTPEAACLVVAPVAMCPLNARNRAISAIQAEQAEAHGCAFWHTAEVSGGHGSLCGWIDARPSLVSRDGLHLNGRGYQILGEELTRAVLGEEPTLEATAEADAP